MIGWQSTFVHQWRTFLAAVVGRTALDPIQATFHDGVRANELGDALLQSAARGERLDLAA